MSELVCKRKNKLVKTYNVEAYFSCLFRGVRGKFVELW